MWSRRSVLLFVMGCRRPLRTSGGGVAFFTAKYIYAETPMRRMGLSRILPVVMTAAFVFLSPVSREAFAGDHVKFGEKPSGVIKFGEKPPGVKKMDDIKPLSTKSRVAGASGRQKCPACGGSGFSSDEARIAAIGNPLASAPDCKLCNGMCYISSEEAGTSTKPPELNPDEWIVAQDADIQVWSSTNGMMVNAKLHKFNGRIVHLWNEAGKAIQIPRSELSKTGQTTLKTVERARLTSLHEAWTTKNQAVQASGEEEIPSVTCPQCRGTGQYDISTTLGGAGGSKPTRIRMTCPTCKGKGKATQRKVDFYWKSVKYNNRHYQGSE